MRVWMISKTTDVEKLLISNPYLKFTTLNVSENIREIFNIWKFLMFTHMYSASSIRKKLKMQQIKDQVSVDHHQYKLCCEECNQPINSIITPIFYAPGSNDWGQIVFVLSVCLSACLSVYLLSTLTFAITVEQ